MGVVGRPGVIRAPVAGTIPSTVPRVVPGRARDDGGRGIRRQGRGWSYIPHFIHSPFYVYAYAFGDCLVNSLYGVYQSKKVKNFEEKYIEMLRGGGIKHHKEMLEPFGLSVSDPKFWQAGLDVIINYIDQLEK